MDTTFESHLPFFTLLKREVLRFLAIPIQTLIIPLVTSSLYLFVFGVSLGSQISVSPSLSYVQFIIPGLIVMGVVNNSFTNSSTSLFLARYLRYIVDFLVTPLTPVQIVLAHTIASILRGLLVGFLIYIISLGFGVLPWAHPLEGILLLILSGFLFAELGIIAAIYSDNFDGLAMFTSLIVTPLIYLGGLFYPVAALPPLWQTISLFNPLAYMIDGFRYAALGTSDIPFIRSFSLTFIFASALFVWAFILVSKGHNLRT